MISAPYVGIVETLMHMTYSCVHVALGEPAVCVAHVGKAWHMLQLETVLNQIGLANLAGSAAQTRGVCERRFST